MPSLRVILPLVLPAVLAACSEPPPPRSVEQLIEDPIMLEAVMVRCQRDGSTARYDTECLNARLATDRIAAREEAEREAEFEAQSERKRQALRRAQQAAAEARRRAAEARRLREEAEYLAQFGELPPEAETSGPAATNAPVAVIPETPSATEGGEQQVVVTFDEPAPRPSAPVAGDGDAAPVTPAEPESPKDLGEIREELRRRNEAD